MTWTRLVPVRWLGLLSLVWSAGCEPDYLLRRHDFVDQYIRFNPEVPRGGIAVWEYHYQDDGDLFGCNEEKGYRTTGWSIDEEAGTFTAHFDTMWETYTMRADDEELYTGTFDYAASIPGNEMTGTWRRSDTPLLASTWATTCWDDIIDQAP